MRDLTDASPSTIAAERARVANDGLGAEILARQEEDGSWRRADTPVWLSTLFTFLLLRATGVDPSEPAVTSAVTRIEESLRWSNHPHWDLRAPEFGGNRFFEGEVEPCINGGVLALGGYFGHPAEDLARRLVGEQLEDGGWNCEAPKSRRSSFHTTICVLEGLARVRASGRVRSGDRGRQAARRGVSAQARTLSTALDRRSRKSGVPRTGVPASLPLRHSSRPRLLPGCRCRA